jgi:hypothetical protein
MGMGVVFITSPDKLSAPPPAARSCLETDLSSLSESKSSSSNVVLKAKTAVVAVMVLVGISLLG